MKENIERIGDGNDLIFDNPKVENKLRDLLVSLAIIESVRANISSSLVIILIFSISFLLIFFSLIYSSL